MLHSSLSLLNKQHHLRVTRMPHLLYTLQKSSGVCIRPYLQGSRCGPSRLITHAFKPRASPSAGQCQEGYYIYLRADTPPGCGVRHYLTSVDTGQLPSADTHQFSVTHSTHTLSAGLMWYHWRQEGRPCPGQQGHGTHTFGLCFCFLCGTKCHCWRYNRTYRSQKDCGCPAQWHQSKKDPRWTQTHKATPTRIEMHRNGLNIFLYTSDQPLDTILFLHELSRSFFGLHVSPVLTTITAGPLLISRQ